MLADGNEAEEKSHVHDALNIANRNRTNDHDILVFASTSILSPSNNVFHSRALIEESISLGFDSLQIGTIKDFALVSTKNDDNEQSKIEKIEQKDVDERATVEYKISICIYYIVIYTKKQKGEKFS